MCTFNFHIAYQRNREMMTTVLDLPLAGERPEWSGLRAGEARLRWWMVVSDPGFVALLEGSGMGFILTQDSSCSLSCLGLQNVWYRIVHTTYCRDCSPAALIIQQVSLPAFPVSKDLSQGSLVWGCEPASPALGKSFCAPFKMWVCCVEWGPAS